MLFWILYMKKFMKDKKIKYITFLSDSHINVEEINPVEIKINNNGLIHDSSSNFELQKYKYSDVNPLIIH